MIIKQIDTSITNREYHLYFTINSRIKLSDSNNTFKVYISDSHYRFKWRHQ